MLTGYDTWLSVLASAAILQLIWAMSWAIPGIFARRNDIVDIGWGLQFIWQAMLVGGVVSALGWRDAGRATLVLALVTVWGLRLALHIGRRALAHREEDRRYAAMRVRWGRLWIVRSIVMVYALQAAIGLLVAQPVLIAVAVQPRPSSLNPLDACALVLVLGGLWLESTADRQLARFLRARTKGGPRYLTTGVWAWSRHPNYAGDAILWWGLGLFGVAGAIDAHAPLLIIPALVGPLIMHLLLRFGSGVPLTERGRVGDAEWDAYVELVPVFLPRLRRARRS